MTNPIQRKERAERLLSDELMQEAREHMRDSITRALWKRHALPPEERERLDAMVRYHETFWAWFERVLADGKLAELEEKQKAEAASTLDRLREKFRI